MILGDIRKGDEFIGIKSGIKGLCIGHLPRSGHAVWQIKIVVGEDLYVIYDSYDMWKNEVEIISRDNDVSQYANLL